jgi:hypothetical protein
MNLSFANGSFSEAALRYNFRHFRTGQNTQAPPGAGRPTQQQSLLDVRRTQNIEVVAFTNSSYLEINASFAIFLTPPKLRACAF